jgi:hypothetical protein
MAAVDVGEYSFEDELLDDEIEEEEDLHVELSEDDAKFVHALILRIIEFGEFFCNKKLFPYQRDYAYRIIESVVINDGEEITALFSRQSGKTETNAFVIATLMVLLPRLAKTYEILSKFQNGLMVGVFGPVDDQASTLWGRVVGFLTSERATEVLLDAEIDDSVAKGREGRAPMITLRSCGSFCRQQTANPRAKIESKSYHIVFIDEAQDADEYTVRKSIHPMMAFYNGTIVKSGTPNRVKGDFYKAIQHNRRLETRRGARQNHFQFDWRYCAKYNPNYERFVKKERSRLGEDSDEFQLAFEIRWLLDRGMLITASRLDELCDTSMKIVRGWHQTPVIVGIDPAKDVDSTVVTVGWVDWDRPDEFGFFHTRPLNWLELQGDKWEEQYFQIYEFLKYYKIWKIGVDTQGVGGPVADRLDRLFPDVEVVQMESTRPAQTARWNHLMQMLNRGKLIFPAHSHARRLRVWKRFYQQMTDAEKHFVGPYVLVEAPDDDADAHDDYVDSLAIMTMLTQHESMPEIEVTEDVLRGR